MENEAKYERTFEAYLINVGIRSSEYTYEDEVLYENIEYFKKCYDYHLSGYKALLFLYDYINDNKKEELFNYREETIERIRKGADVSEFGDPVEWQKKEREDRNDI